MSIKEIWQIAKTITIGDIIGVIALFIMLYGGLLLVLVYQ